MKVDGPKRLKVDNPKCESGGSRESKVDGSKRLKVNGPKHKSGVHLVDGPSRVNDYGHFPFG